MPTAFDGTAADGSTLELLYGYMAGNDQFRILIGGSGDNGYVEIATADNGNEPIYVRQYGGVFGSIVRSAALLDGSGNTSFPGNVTAYASDKRLKENFNHIENPLEKIKNINGYTFDWKNSVEKLGFTPKNKKNEVGLIAQEVQEILPQAVFPAPFDLTVENGKNISKSGENYLTIQYDKLIPLLVECIKEQQEQIEELKNKISDLLE